MTSPVPSPAALARRGPNPDLTPPRQTQFTEPEHRSYWPQRPPRVVFDFGLEVARQMSDLAAVKAPCPRPDKLKYRSDQIKEVLAVMKRKSPDYNAYECECGWMHIGKSNVLLARRMKRLPQHRTRGGGTGRKR